MADRPSYAAALEIVGSAILDLPLPFYPDGTRRFNPELEFIEWPDELDDDDNDPLVRGH